MAALAGGMLGVQLVLVATQMAEHTAAAMFKLLDVV
jgi:hypothetical protein